MPKTSPAARAEPVTTDPADVVRRFLELISSRRAGEGAELLADDVAWCNSGWPTIRGGARVGGMLRDMDRRGIDFEAVVHHLAADGDHVLTERTDRIGYRRLRTEFPVQGTFQVTEGRIALWDDHFSHLRLTASLIRNLVR